MGGGSNASLDVRESGDLLASKLDCLAGNLVIWPAHLPFGPSFCRAFFPRHNTEHRHGGNPMLTPERVHFGRANEILAQRKSVLRADWAARPAHFVSAEPRRDPSRRPPRSIPSVNDGRRDLRLRNVPEEDHVHRRNDLRQGADLVPTWSLARLHDSQVVSCWANHDQTERVRCRLSGCSGSGRDHRGGR